MDRFQNVQTMVAEQPSAGRISEQTFRTRQLAKRLDECVCRLSQLADRVIGHEPKNEGVGKGVGIASVQPALVELADASEHVAVLIQQLENHIGRLESL